MSRTPMQFFEAISAIPRVSGNEKAVADFVEQLAREKGYEVRRDAMHNMVVVRPASAGCEHCDTFMMQGHLDMVAAAKEGVTHNFDTDPIELVRDRISAAFNIQENLHVSWEPLAGELRQQDIIRALSL